MDVDDWVFVIDPDDRFYGEKSVISAVEVDFNRRITGYTVQKLDGVWRDYLPTDLQYTTRYRRTFTSQMQLL